MNNELEGVWMEASVSWLKVVAQRRLKEARQSENKYVDRASDLGFWIWTRDLQNMKQYC